MGFFSKVFKSVGKVFKKIGKGIKSAFKKFGKFMNKIGILGQVAMFFIMPYVGAALGGMWTGIAGQTAAQTAATAATNTAAVTAGQAAGATAGQVAAGKVAETAIASAAKAGIVAGKATGLMAGGTVAQTVGKVMQFTANTVGKAGTVFNNITKGVTDTLGNFAKTASNNMFGTTFDAASNFFGAGDSAFSRSFGGDSRFQNLTGSETLFETSKQKRIAETEAKLNTNSGQKAMDQTVAESAGDSRAYGQTKFRNDPIYDQAIREGGTEMTASLGQPSPDLAFPEAVDVVKFDPMNQENFARGMIDDTISPTGDGFQTLVGNVNPDAVYQPSLMERLKTGISEAPANIYKKAGEIADDPLGYATKGMEETFQSGVKTRIMQETGIQAKPEYTQNYVSNVAYVPSFESFGGSQQQYGAPEIMNARSFEQQVTNNPSPYGYTAFQYGNYMAQSAQTA